MPTTEIWGRDSELPEMENELLKGDGTALKPTENLHWLLTIISPLTKKEVRQVTLEVE